MDQVVQTNAAQTEELSATADQLSLKSQELQALVQQFNLTKRSEHPAESSFVSTLSSGRSRTGLKSLSRSRNLDRNNETIEDKIEAEFERELELITAGKGGNNSFESF